MIKLSSLDEFSINLVTQDLKFHKYMQELRGTFPSLPPNSDWSPKIPEHFQSDSNEVAKTSKIRKSTAQISSNMDLGIRGMNME